MSSARIVDMSVADPGAEVGWGGALGAIASPKALYHGLDSIMLHFC